MAQPETIDRVLGKTPVPPLWWRIPPGAAITALCMLQADGVPLRVATGLLTTAAAVAIAVHQERAVGDTDEFVVIAASSAPFAFDGTRCAGSCSSSAQGNQAAALRERDPIRLGLDDVPALVERHPGGRHALRTRDARGAPVAVTLMWADGTLEAVVRATGPMPGRTVVTGQVTGLGLAGMSERVRALGGSVRAGAGDGGWRWLHTSRYAWGTRCRTIRAVAAAVGERRGRGAGVGG